MTFENQFVKKSYYHTFLLEGEKENAVRVLAEAYLDEQSKELAELSYIRFAQGELYFHNKDFEAAIFKWENVNNELEQWARKNIADSYLELRLFPTAEEIYKSISTEDLTLKSEIALQLFSLYIERGKLDLADKVIKKAISLNPDYPNVTEIARLFFEEHGDWSSAIELAVNESIRSHSLPWFDILHTYIVKGMAKTIAPDYFSEALITLFSVSKDRFEEMASALWNNYKDQESYLTWIQSFDKLLLQIEISREDRLHDLSNLYKETYFELINGKYYIKKLSNVIPNLLTNWLNISDYSEGVLASAAVLSWSEIFPSSISPSVVLDAENLIHQADYKIDKLEYSHKLFESIMEWAQQGDVEISHRTSWIVQQLLDLQTHHLLIAGSSGNGKSSFINSILGENMMEGSTTSVVMFKDSDESAITEITDTDLRAVSDVTDIINLSSLSRQTAASKKVIEYKLPNQFLHDHSLALMEVPGFKRTNTEQNEMFSYVHFADSLLFVLNANDPFNEREREILLQIREIAPTLSVHFLLNKIDDIYNEQEAMTTVEETWDRINKYFPNANVFAYSSQYKSHKQLQELSEFIKTNFKSRNPEEERTAKLLLFIRKTIKDLIEKRVEMENDLIESINWNEDLLDKLNGAINQVSDLEKEKRQIIRRSYQEIKDDIKKDLTDTIPQLLRNCSSLITEESDFRKIHIHLNDEMNDRIQNYLEDTILPKFYYSIQEWIKASNEEFNHGKFFLEEMSEGFNALYGEERIKLDCDFGVLEDWSRDANRMTSGVQMERVNILLRFTPSQFLLKSAGKLLGAIGQSKTMLYNKYKEFIENENYEDVTASIINKFLMQFELFEKALDRDVKMFFKESLSVLNEAVEETRTKIQEKQDALTTLKSNPEAYRDPLTLFELRLRQYEWIMIVSKDVQYIY